MSGKITRRALIQGAVLTVPAALLAACEPRVETIEKEVTRVIQGTPQVVKETVVVEKTVAPRDVKVQIMWRTQPAENELIDEWLNDFMTKFPHIKMEKVIVPWEQFETKLMALYAAGTAPDIYGTGGTNPYVERFYRGMVTVLDELVAREGNLLEQMWPVAVKSYTIQNKLIGLSFSVVPGGTYYNATHFEKAGLNLPPVDWKSNAWTWDEMVDVAKQLVLDRDGDGKIDQWGVVCYEGAWEMVRGYGVDLVSDEDYQTGLCHGWVETQEVKDALVDSMQKQYDLVYTHKVTPDADTMTTLYQVGDIMKTGAMGMVVGGAWTLWGDLPRDYKFGSAPFPIIGRPPKGNRGKNCWVEPIQISSQARHIEEAWTFAKYMLADTDAINLSLKHRETCPALKGALPLYIKATAGRQVMSEADAETYNVGALEDATVTSCWHILVGWAKIYDAYANLWSDAVTGKKTPREAADAMYLAVKEVALKNLQELGLE